MSRSRFASAVTLLLAPAWPSSRVGRLALAALYFAGAALSLSFLYSVAEAPGVLAAAGAVTALYFVSNSATKGVLRFVGRSAFVLLVAVHLLVAYVAVSFGLLLGWTASWGLRAGWLVVAAGVVGAAFRKGHGFRIPALVPLGLWISLCLVGWLREDGATRCDDYFRAASQPGVRWVVPVSADLKQCVPGASLRTARYPRQVWEDPEGGRYVVTTQKGIRESGPPGTPVSDPISGSICEAFEGETVRYCVGNGKAQRILDSREHDRLFVISWGHHEEGKKGRVYAVSRSAPIRLLGEVATNKPVVEGFYDPMTDRLGIFDDDCSEMLPIRASDLSVLPSIAATVCPDATRYDELRGEGVLCIGSGPILPLAGTAYSAMAFRGRPFSIRPIGQSPDSLTSWLSLSWGCDMDLERRRSYASVATLGIVETIDYDSGRVLRRQFVALGARSVVFDPARRWLFVGDFLRGTVTAIDAESGVTRGHWFVGRFVRQIVMARNGRDVLVSSNLGVLRVSPDQLPSADGAASAPARAF